MLVGYNITYFRKALGLTQAQLADRLGWTNVAVSAAERSWDGKRVRGFDASELVMLARALGVPMAALFLPPEDDLVDCRYVTVVGEDDENDIADMRFLLGAAMSDPRADESLPSRVYEERYVRTVHKYLEARLADAVAMRVRERVLEEELASRMRSAKRNWKTLADFKKSLDRVMSDNGLLQNLLVEMLAGTDRGQELLADIAGEEEAAEQEEVAAAAQGAEPEAHPGLSAWDEIPELVHDMMLIGARKLMDRGVRGPYVSTLENDGALTVLSATSGQSTVVHPEEAEEERAQAEKADEEVPR
jgi:transcriptional regulator with XRE-family HTH domain